MRKKPRVCVLRAAGTNCDQETVFAFLQAGAEAELTHINSLIKKEFELGDYQILAIPGGFTYGDDIAAGKILANELRYRLIDVLKSFIADGKLIIGICNGFQVLVKSGLLPGNKDLKQEASLVINDSGKFEDRWVYLRGVDGKGQKAKCVWTKNLPEIIYLPIAHGEGKFVTKDKKVLQRLRKNCQIVFRYHQGNPNGSEDNIAGICDETGRVFGLMPHPERHIFNTQHPKWTAFKDKRQGDGMQVFKNGVEYARKILS